MSVSQSVSQVLFNWSTPSPAGRTARPTDCQRGPPAPPATWSTTSSAPALILRIMLGAPKTRRYVGHIINLIAGWATGAIVVWRSTWGNTTKMTWGAPSPTSRWPSLIILQATIGRRGSSSWRRIGSSSWGPLGRQDSTQETSCSVSKEEIGDQAIN